MPLSDVFTLTRIINLLERTDRYREMAAQLDMLGMSLSANRVEMFAARRVEDAAGFTSASVRGCFLSHLEVLREAHARGVESVLVLEDDLEVLPANVARLEKLAQSLRGRKWGIVYLGHFLPPVSAKCEPRWDAFAGDLQTAHFYAVHRDVLGRLIDYLEQCQVRPPGDPVGGPMEYDGALSMFRRWNPDVVTLIAQPGMGGQRSSRSSIHARKIESVPGVGMITGLLRKIKRAFK